MLGCKGFIDSVCFSLATVSVDQVILYHCVKSVHIRSCSGPYFHTFGLNTNRYSVSLRIQLECGKKQTRKTPNTDTFYAVLLFDFMNVFEKACNTLYNLR